MTGGQRAARGGLRRPGQALAEFALIVPLFFLAILMLAEGAAFALTFNTVEHATQEGGRLAALPGTADEAAVRSRVIERAAPALASIDATDITITVTGCAAPPCAYVGRTSGDRVAVVVNYEYRPLTSAVFAGLVFNLSAATQYLVE